jgi:NitT/TauT family transport system permease protein
MRGADVSTQAAPQPRLWALRNRRTHARSDDAAIRDGAIAWGSLTLGALVWEVGGRLLDLSYFPPLSSVLVKLYELTKSGVVLTNVTTSILNLAVGFGAAIVVGLVLGVLMARVPWIEEALDPYVYALLTAPTVVFVPIYFSLFGLSRWAIICLIFQYGVFIIVVNTVTAVKTVEVQLVEMALVFGAKNEWAVVRKVILPAALPLISAGVRLGMGRCVKGMINGEILIALVGLGGISATFARAYDSEGVFAILLVVIIVAVVADGLVGLLDKRVNSWLPRNQR